MLEIPHILGVCQLEQELCTSNADVCCNPSSQISLVSLNWNWAGAIGSNSALNQGHVIGTSCCCSCESRHAFPAHDHSSSSSLCSPMCQYDHVHMHIRTFTW